jgi:predicted RNase H-like HicB family nuclease
MCRTYPVAWPLVKPSRVEEEIRVAIRFHIEGLKADGLEVPAATSIPDYVEA